MAGALAASECSTTTRRRRRRRQLPTNQNDKNASNKSVGVRFGNDEYDDNGSGSSYSSSGGGRNKMTTRRNQLSQQQRRRRHRKKDEDDDDLPFVYLFLRVAVVVAILFLIVYFAVFRRFFPRQQEETYYIDDDDDVVYSNNAGIIREDGGGVVMPKQRKELIDQPLVFPAFGDTADKEPQLSKDFEPAIPPLPTWNLTVFAQHFDAFALAEQFQPSTNDKNKNTESSHDNSDDDQQQQLALFWQTASGLRSLFAETYGGENAARALLDRGITDAFSSSDDNATEVEDNVVDEGTTTTRIPRNVQETACRILRAHDERRPFRFAFGGYSVTAGRGNLFEQSFPFVMEKQLHTVFHLLGIELNVRNAAIGGCPSFPYGWCLRNFWGDHNDVVSWDYSMNEAGGDPVGLEAYLRHVMTLNSDRENDNNNKAPPPPPKLIVKDTHMAVDRVKLLEYYHKHSQSPTAVDPIIVHTDTAVKPFLDRKEEHRPVGFQEWRKFGSPPGAPGQSLHHPAVKEHELIAWLLSMHFLSALELVAAHKETKNDFELACAALPAPSDTRHLLPEPVHGENDPNRTKPWTSMLFGEQITVGQDGNNWAMNRIHCRTSFDPIVSGHLTDLVMSGSVGADLDVMLPKSKMFYNRGWVLDMSDEEKKAKRNLNRFGGLGFIDSKKAYYGIFASGTLTFHLPLHLDEVNNETIISSGDDAREWVKSIVLCEVNEKRTSGACNIGSGEDVHYTVGGANVTDVASLDSAGALYLGKKICTHISIPEGAVLSCFANAGSSDCGRVGLELGVAIRNQHINRREDACSISHVLWEQKTTKMMVSPPKQVFPSK